MFLYFLDVYFTYSLQLFICILYIMTDTLPSNIYGADSIETSSTPKQTPLTTYTHGLVAGYIKYINQFDIIIKPCYYAYKDYTSLLYPDTKKNDAYLNNDCNEFLTLLDEQKFDLVKNEEIFYPLYLQFIDRLKTTRFELTKLLDEISRVRMDLASRKMDLASRKKNAYQTGIIILNTEISELGEARNIIYDKIKKINYVLFKAPHYTDIKLFVIEYDPKVDYKESIKNILTFTMLGGKAKNKKAKKSTKNRKTKNKKAKNKKAKRRTKRRTKN